MILNKVEICGVNTSRLPLLTAEEKNTLFERIKKGDKEDPGTVHQRKSQTGLKRHQAFLFQQ